MTQRYYVPRAGSAGDTGTPITPPFASGWEKTSTAVRLPASTTKTGATGGDNLPGQTVGTGTDPNDVLFWQGVAGPFAAQTIGGYWKASGRAKEFDAAVNARAQLVVRCFNLAGDTVLATLIDFNTDALGAEWNAVSYATQRWPYAYADPGYAISATISEPFYLVPEFGTRIHSTDTSAFASAIVTDEFATDASETEGVTTASRNTWFELSSDLTAYSPPAEVVDTFPVVEARVAWRPEQFNKVTNPGFETNTTGWSVSAGINGAGTSITRITTDFHSGVGSGSLVCPATIDTGVNFDFGAQTFFQSSVYGIAYRFVVWLKSTSGTTQASIIVGSEGTSSDRRSRDISLTTEWQPFYIDWLPTGTRTDVQLAITNTVAVAMTAKIDDVAVYIRDAHTQVENGYFTTNTTGWSVGAGINGAGTTITRQASGGFYGVACGRLVTTGTSGSGMNFDLGTSKYTSGRTYRARVYLRSISDSTSARLRLGSLGTGADRGDASVTITTEWAAYTVNWTPSGDRTDAELAITNGSAAIVTADVDGVEVYEALDDVSADAFAVNGGQILSYGRGASFDGGTEAAGFATYRVVNTSGKYTPENSSGSLYGSLEAGKRILFRATYDGAPYALFYGQIDRLVPLPMEYAAELQCTDPLEELSRMSVHVAELAGSYKAARTAAMDQVYITSLNYSAESGAIENLYAYRGTDERGLLDYLNDLNVATGSVHFVQPQIYASAPWKLVSRDRTVHSDATTTSETWNDDMADLSGYDVTREALVNRQRVDVTGYGPTFRTALIEAYVPESHSPIDDPDGAFYFLPGPVSGEVPKEALPLTIPANTKRVIHFSFSVPVTSMGVAGRIGYSSGSATETEDESSTTSVLTLEAGSTDAVIESVSFAGDLLLQLPLNDSDRKDEESIWLRGERQGNPISSRYIQHPAHADGLADWRIWRYKAPRARPTITRVNQYESHLEREVADRIEVTFARLSVSTKVFVIRSFTTTVTQNSHEWSTMFNVEELPAHPADGWFKLNTSALGGDAVLAY